MGILHNLKLQFAPPRITDDDFGTLLFMFLPKAPERSYWECEWKFPATGTVISIVLPGGENGPLPEARRFYLDLPGRFESILAAARPSLGEVFDRWLHRELPQSIFSAVALAGFGLRDPTAQPVHWEISFETIGEQPGAGPGDPKWLCITVPFIGETVQKAVVDT